MPEPVGHSRGSQLLKSWRGSALQSLAADRLGLDAATYNRFERGKRKPQAEVCFQIERLTVGAVPARSWFEPPAKCGRKRAA